MSDARARKIVSEDINSFNVQVTEWSGQRFRGSALRDGPGAGVHEEGKANWSMCAKVITACWRWSRKGFDLKAACKAANLTKKC